MNSNYDLISSIYDFDMALNMQFNDIQFYVDHFIDRKKILELGCGTGRITLPLLKEGRDIFAVDSSIPMLSQLKHKIAKFKINKSIHVIAMDAKNIALKEKFDSIFFSFSGINYLSNPQQVINFLLHVKNLFTENGTVLLDAFVPPTTATQHLSWQHDYRRTLPDGKILQRSKMITKLDCCNEVKRRYEILTSDENIIETIETNSIIHPYTPNELRSLLTLCDYKILGEWWDYGNNHENIANFFTVEAKPNK